MTENEINLLGDFKGQLASIRKNIDIANNQLEADLSSSRIAREELTSINEESKFHKDALNDLYNLANNKQRVLDTKLSEFNDKENTFLKFKESEEIRLVNLEKSLIERHSDEEIYSQKLTKRINELSDKLNDVENLLNKKESEIPVIEKDIENLQVQRSLVEVSIPEEISHKNEILGSINSLIDIKKKELQSVQDSIDRMNESKTLIAEDFENRQYEFSLREKQFRVIKARTERIFNILYPNNNMDLILPQ